MQQTPSEKAFEAFIKRIREDALISGPAVESLEVALLEGSSDLSQFREALAVRGNDAPLKNQG
jgi:hypothetical protein